MDELALLAVQADNLEKESEANPTLKPSQANSSSQSSVESSQVLGDESSKNMAESLLKIAEGSVQVMIDNRLGMNEDDINDGREKLSPLIEKHNLALGSGKNPYAEEVGAGFYIGGLIKRTIKSIKELRLLDKKRNEKQDDNNGDQREHASTEPSRTVPSPERVREKSDTETEGWLKEPG